MPSEDRGEDPIKVVSIMANALWLAVRLMFVLMRLKRKAKRAARLFRKAAVKGGMDRRLAGQLAEEYAGYTSIRKIMRSMAGENKIPFLS
jgi:hypothetical protein